MRSATCATERSQKKRRTAGYGAFSGSLLKLIRALIAQGFYEGIFTNPLEICQAKRPGFPGTTRVASAHLKSGDQADQSRDGFTLRPETQGRRKTRPRSADLPACSPPPPKAGGRSPARGGAGARPRLGGVSLVARSERSKGNPPSVAAASPRAPPPRKGGETG